MGMMDDPATGRHLCRVPASLQPEQVSSALASHKATQAVPCRQFHKQHNVSKEFSICQ